MRPTALAWALVLATVAGAYVLCFAVELCHWAGVPRRVPRPLDTWLD